MMNVSRFCGSTFFRKPKGRAAIDWRHDVERLRGLVAQGLLDQRLGQVDAAAGQAQRVGVRVGELVDHRLLLFAAQPAELGDLDRDQLDLLGRRASTELRRLLLRQAHQQDRGFADVGDMAVSSAGLQRHDAGDADRGVALAVLAPCQSGVSRNWRRVAGSRRA